MRRSLYSSVEYLSMARTCIANAQWFKSGGNVDAVRASLANARFFIRRARQAAGCDAQRQDVTQCDAATV